MSEPALVARSLRKRFAEVLAVDGVDLQVAPGEVHGLLGPNGAGKTTVLRMLLGLLWPDEGEIALLGAALDPARGLPEGVAGFAEEPRFYPYLSARANLELLARLDDGVAAPRIDEVLEQTGLDDRAGRTVGGFSTGMRQRLGVAAALLREPRLLVLDEPTSGLDPAGARELVALVRRLADGGAAVLFSSHRIVEVEGLCDAVTILRDGRVVYTGAVAELRARAPMGVHLLRTSEDAAALRLAAGGVDVDPRDDGLRVVATGDALDAYVLDLARSGIAVRTLQPVMTPMESMYFELTGDAPQREPEPAAS